MSDDPANKGGLRWEIRRSLIERLRTPWDAMSDMGNQQRAEAAVQISTMIDEIEAWRQAVRKAERDIMQLRQQVAELRATNLALNDEAKNLRAQRDTIRRTFCLMIASGDWNIRDGSTAFRSGAEHVAELNHWDCFREKP